MPVLQTGDPGATPGRSTFIVGVRVLVEQWVARRIVDPEVGGSSPRQGRFSGSSNPLLRKSQGQVVKWKTHGDQTAAPAQAWEFDSPPGYFCLFFSQSPFDPIPLSP